MLDREAHELFSCAANPLFAFERRRMRWLRDESSLTRYCKITWVAATLVVLAVWLSSTVASGGNPYFQDRFALIMALAAFIITIVVDFYAAFSIAYKLHRQIHSDQWELILISRQQNWNTFQAAYSIAQLRSWRPMSIDIAFRIALIELILLGTLRFWITSRFTLWLFPPSWLMLIPVGIMIAICAIEPFWRMKALSLIAMGAAANLKNLLIVYLTVFGAVAAIHVLQLVTFAGVWYLIIEPAVTRDNGVFTIICGALPIGAVLSICCTYLLYTTLRNFSWKLTIKGMFAPVA